MQERGGNLTSHALPEGKLADGNFQQILNLKRLCELANPHLGLAVIHLEDLSEEGECVNRGEVIPQLWALTKYSSNLISEFLAFLPGNKTKHFRIAAGRMKDAGQHFDRGRFPRAV